MHQIRNSLKYVISRDQKAFMLDLKLIYKATSKDLAEHHLLELGEKWGKKYPAVIKSWRANWEALSHYFKYPEDLRRLYDKYRRRISSPSSQIHQKQRSIYQRKCITKINLLCMPKNSGKMEPTYA